MNTKMLKVLSILGILTFTAFILTYFLAIEFTAFTVGMVKYILAISLAWVVDKYAIPNVNSVELISKEPVAYAIFIFANFTLAAACIASS